ncbi:MAG: hypothetical protein HYZ73_05375 [Elusimicrobia bacterium]|nr:hypothetical protein [Elusimicrobiota bacterium]
MQRRPWISLVAIAGVLASAAGCAGPRVRPSSGGGQEYAVEADGLAPYEASDLIGTKKRALAEAQKAAVEQVVGVHITSRTRVEKAITIEQRILARTEGYISHYEILKEGQEEGFYKTRIRAWVRTSQISEDLKELGLLKAPAPGRPRVAIRLEEFIEGQPHTQATAATALAQGLLEQGYQVVEDPAKAELLITGRAEANPQTIPALGGFLSYRALLIAKVQKAGTQEVLLTISEQAPAVDASSLIAAAKALQAAAGLAAERTRRLAQELQRRAKIALTVRGVKSLTDVNSLKQTLEKTAGVEEVLLRSLANGVAELEVLGQSLVATELVNRLTTSSTLALELTELSGNRLILTFK